MFSKLRGRKLFQISFKGDLRGEAVEVVLSCSVMRFISISLEMIKMHGKEINKLLEQNVSQNISLLLQIGEDLVMVNKFDSFEPVNGQPPPSEVKNDETNFRLATK